MKCRVICTGQQGDRTAEDVYFTTEDDPAEDFCRPGQVVLDDMAVEIDDLPASFPEGECLQRSI